MSRLRARHSGWQGVCLVAVTYVYFLIFAQFAFLNRLARLGIADNHLKLVMGAMAVGGILASLIAPRIAVVPSPIARLRIALSACAAAALLALLPLSTLAGAVVAALIGIVLGLLTVTLVTHLSDWLGSGDQLLKVGIGTGIGYLICNFPPLFTAAPEVQATFAATLCLIAVIAASRPSVVLRESEDHDTSRSDCTTRSVPVRQNTVSFGFVLLCFTALVWLDSAAFFIIQSTPSLKAGTWQGNAHLWANGLLHLGAAIASAMLLRRRRLSFVLGLAVGSLAVACLLMRDPSHVPLASVFYPIGVSLYSVGLVAYPSLLCSAASIADRARRAGLIYAIAGWVGSAMGIGMGQNLGYVPVAFVALACVAVLGPQLFHAIRGHRREAVLVAAVLLLALAIQRAIDATHAIPSSAAQIERGRRVYIAEGCIHCHSQYVRPNTKDVAMWGPVQDLDRLQSQQPPLIGNRRQGPDLSEVGIRRSPLWLRAHFYDPQEVSDASFMPRYRHLFGPADNRGDDLIAYLASLHGSDVDKRLADELLWQPASITLAGARTLSGPQLFEAYCATCHAADGRTRLAWQANFKRLPPNLSMGPFLHLPVFNAERERVSGLARIVKFGIPGTDMPGHEYLSDRDVSALSLWLAESIPQPISNRYTIPPYGEKQ